MNFEYIDNIYRSRITLLNILEERGYDVSALRKFSPAEISVAAGSTELLPSLRFVVKHKENENHQCIVEYSQMKKPKLMSYLESAMQEKDDVQKEYIFMLLDPLSDAHHQIALQYYLTQKIKVSFFHIPYIVFDPRNHVLVPKHEIITNEEEKVKLLEEWNIPSKSHLPKIRYHVDPIIRILGAVPGDIIRITRPSPSAGTYTFYRIVSA
jgi:DNA-directed RNA polymerase subunit H (RpoH/RPB5)